MLTRKEEILFKRIQFFVDNEKDEETRKIMIDKRENKCYYDWIDRVKAHLPSLAKRVFALRKKFYEGCGFHYSLEKTLGNVIRDVNDYDRRLSDIDEMAHRITVRIIVHSLFKRLDEIEKELRIKKKVKK